MITDNTFKIIDAGENIHIEFDLPKDMLLHFDMKTKDVFDWIFETRIRQALSKMYNIKLELKKDE